MNAVSTAVIAFATVAYVGCTIALWRSTRRAADAALKSAEAAKQSAEIAVSLNRPFVGLLRVVPVSLLPRIAENSIAWTLKNFGVMSAVKVDASAKVSVGPHLYTSQGPSSAEIFPGAEVETQAIFHMMDAVRQSMHSGDQPLVVIVQVKYSAPDGRRFAHEATAHYRHEAKAFVVLSSETKPA